MLIYLLTQNEFKSQLQNRCNSNISPGLITVQRPFFGGFYSGRGGIFKWNNIQNFTVRKKETCLTV